MVCRRVTRTRTHPAHNTTDPNFAAIVLPWRVDITISDAGNATAHPGDPALHKRTLSSHKAKLDDAKYRANVEAVVTYVCPPPFCTPGASSQPFPAHNATATIALPKHVTLIGGQQTQTFSSVFQAGTSASVRWNVEITDRINKSGEGQETEIEVSASGLISASVPFTYCCEPDVWSVCTQLQSLVWLNVRPVGRYPAYVYQDVIGGFGTAHI